MNDHVSFERFVADRFADVERVASPAHSIDDILIEARRMRPLPRWLAIIKEPPMRISSRVAVGSPIVRVASLTILVMILSVLTAGGMAVGATLLASPVPSGPATFVVAQDGSGDFTTISEAVAVAQDGDTIQVKPGTYPENISISTDITLEGDGPAGSVVIAFSDDGPTVPTLLGGTVPYGIALKDSNAHLSNLAVTSASQGSGFWVSGGAPTLEGLSVTLPDEFSGWPPMAFEFVGGTTATLSDSTGSWFLGVDGGSSPTIERIAMEAGSFIRGTGTDPLIRDSRFAFALDISGGAEPTIERNNLLGLAIMAGTPVIRDNTFANPAFVAGAEHSSSEEVTAIEVTGGSPLIVGNRIGDHEVGISVGVSTTPAIQDNLIEANTTGIEVSGVSTSPIISDNTFCDNGTDLTVPEGSAVTLDGNTVCEAGASSAP